MLGVPVLFDGGDLIGKRSQTVANWVEVRRANQYRVDQRLSVHSCKSVLLEVSPIPSLDCPKVSIKVICEGILGLATCCWFWFLNSPAPSGRRQSFLRALKRSIMYAGARSAMSRTLVRYTPFRLPSFDLVVVFVLFVGVMGVHPLPESFWYKSGGTNHCQ